MNARVDLPPAREVCPTTTRRLISQGALLVDVRERAEIDRLAFDVPDIVALPLSELEQRFSELSRDRELVLACAVGERSLKAAYFLMYQGYTRVANMEGGLAKWVCKGFPVKGDIGAASADAAGNCCGSAVLPPASGDGGGAAPSVDSACCAPASTARGCCDDKRAV
jgi:rhodanese-related sulfurtransferase